MEEHANVAVSAQLLEQGPVSNQMHQDATAGQFKKENALECLREHPRATAPDQEASPRDTEACYARDTLQTKERVDGL